jgi:hexosaminidase
LLDNVIGQTATLFNNQTTLYAQNEVSVGGDEVSSGAWSQDSSCSGAWQNLSALEKSHKFFQLLAQNHGQSKISGWQQYVQNEDRTLGQNIVPALRAGHVWVWNTTTGGIAQAQTLLQNNYPVVLAFADQEYFDLAYTPNVNEPGYYWAGRFLDTFAALNGALSASEVIGPLSNSPSLQGIEGTLWSENLSNNTHMIYMALPKMAGLAEAAWSSSAVTTENNKTDWQDLARRLGCGQTGFLAYLNRIYSVQYRGYPHGIAREVPQCVG